MTTSASSVKMEEPNAVGQSCRSTDSRAEVDQLQSGVLADMDPRGSKSARGYGPPLADLDPLSDVIETCEKERKLFQSL